MRGDAKFSALFNRSLAGVLLLLVSPPALAQKIPLWLAVGVVSPAWALVLIVALALCAPKVGRAGLHAILLLLWIVTFYLASNYVRNDWVIWTPMHLYIVQLALLPIFLFYRLVRSIETSAVTPTRSLLLVFLSVFLSVPTSFFVTFLLIVPLDYLGKATGIDTMGREGPELWCFVVIWIVLQSAMLAAWMIHRKNRGQTPISGS